MASLRRFSTATPANGKNSQGPVTLGANFLLAGIHGRAADHPEFLELHASLAREWSPVTPTEQITVRTLAVAFWRLGRARAAETALIEAQMSLMEGEIKATYKTIDATTRMALAFRRLVDDSPALETIHRYEDHLSRQAHRCLYRLWAIRSERKKRNFQTTLVPKTDTLSGQNLKANPEPGLAGKH